jgi:hypothetical protein
MAPEGRREQMEMKYIFDIWGILVLFRGRHLVEMNERQLPITIFLYQFIYLLVQQAIAAFILLN